MSTIDRDKIKEFLDQVHSSLTSLNDNDTLITSIVLDIIKNYLSADLYENIPKELNEILSTQDFTSSIDLSKKILVSYGIPEDLVNKLSVIDIQKILKSLQLFISDYSTVKFIKDIVDLFNEDIYVAELNLVYNKDINDVYLVPNWIVEPSKELKSKYSTISYDTVYNNIPELLITKNEWITQFQNNNAVTPLKTNILLIVTDNQQSISLLNEIISQIIFNYLKDKKLILYYDKTFEIQFEDIIKLYYYIVALFENIDKLTINHPNIVDVKYSAENNNFLYSDIDNLISKHNNIKDKSTYDDFMQYIKQNFSHLIHKQPNEYDFFDLQSYLYTKYPSLIQYLNSLYNNSINKKYDLFSLIIKTRKSVNFNFYNVRFINIFIETYLFIKRNSIDNILSYQFINYYKPANILILNEIIDYTLLTIDDRLTNLYLESFIKSIYISINSADNNPIRFDIHNLIEILQQYRVYFDDIVNITAFLDVKEQIKILELFTMLINIFAAIDNNSIRFDIHNLIELLQQYRVYFDDAINISTNSSIIDEIEKVKDKINLYPVFSLADNSPIRFDIHNLIEILQQYRVYFDDIVNILSNPNIIDDMEKIKNKINLYPTFNLVSALFVRKILNLYINMCLYYRYSITSFIDNISLALDKKTNINLEDKSSVISKHQKINFVHYSDNNVNNVMPTNSPRVLINDFFNIIIT